MFDHVSIRVSDRAAARAFYGDLFGALRPDVPCYVSDDYDEWFDFGIGAVLPDRPLTRRLDVTFAVAEPRADALDPDGNTVRFRVAPESVSAIASLRLAVRDVEASRRFYDAIAPACGAVGVELVESSAPTEHLHIAFPAPTNAHVDEFHRLALAAGYRDNGGPGERPVYHPGYYGAFVLDPDGNNVEAVCHHRP